MKYSTFRGGRRFALIITLLTLTISACTGLGGEPDIVGALPTEQPGAQNPPSQIVTVNEPASLANINIATGAQVFAENCTSCHGPNGQGDGELVKSGQVGEIRDFTNLETRLDVSPHDFFTTITNGRLEKLMPPWSGSLNASERWSVAMYVYSLAYGEGKAAEGEALYDAAGANDQPITVDYSKVTDGQLLAGQFLPEFASDLDAGQREAVVAYIRTLPVIDDGSDVETAAAGTVDETTGGPDTASVPDTAGAPDTAANTGGSEAASVPEVLGTVTGQVTNGTAGGTIPTGGLIELHVVDGSFQGEIIPGVIEEDGTFTFNDVPMRNDRGYLVAVEYDDFFFASEFRQLPDGAASIDLPVTVYEASNENSGIIVESVIAQLFAQGGTLQVLQIVNLQNTSDTMYVGEEPTSSTPDAARTTVGFAVPEGAQYVDMTGEGRFVLSPDERIVYDTRPVMPGEPHTLHLLFNLPYRKGATFEQTLMYPMQGELGFELRTDGLAFTSEQVQPLGDAAMTGTQLFAGDVNLTAGDLISFNLSGDAPVSEQTTAQTSNPAAVGIQPTTIMIIVGVIFIAIAIALFWFDRQKSTQTATAGAIDDTVGENEELNALLRQVAELDLKFKAGEIKEAKYQNQRKALKAKIATLAKQKQGTD